MAYYYIDGKIHDVRATKAGICTKCGGEVRNGWKVSLLIGISKGNEEVARYCKKCVDGTRSDVVKTHLTTLADGRTMT